MCIRDSFIDREPKPLLGVAQLGASPSGLRDVTRDGADAEDARAARVADHEMLVGHRDRRSRLPMSEVGLAGPSAALDHRLDDYPLDEHPDPGVLPGRG